MNPIILLLAFTVAFSNATPTSYVSSKSSVSSYVVPTVTILKQINQLNDDGSYTFGYEASDGSFRVENMDVNGYLTGRYGYVDSYGKTQETEYAAGKMSGQSVGFQARGSLIAEEVGRSAQPFPFIRSATTKSLEQKALDYQYTSVDDDEDGFPDAAPSRSSNYNTAEVVRLSTPTQQVSYINNPSAPTIVRVADPYDATVSNVRTVTPVRNNYNNAGVVRIASATSAPTIDRVADPYATATISDVRLVTPERSYSNIAGDVRLASQAKKSYDSAPIEVRVNTDSYGNSGLSVSDVRLLTTPTQTSSQVSTAENVRLASAPTRNSHGSTNTVVRVIDQSDDGYGKIADVRVAPPTRVSYEKEPTIVRIANREKATYDTIVKQTIDQPSKTVNQVSDVPVFRSPSYGASAVRSTVRLDDFLKSLKKNKNSGSYPSYNTYGSGGTTFINQDQFIQTTQDFQVNQDDAVSIDSLGFTRII